MKEIVAYCGISCTECPAYQATQNDDAAARAKVAETWKTQFHMEIKPEDINCDGCLPSGARHIGYCAFCEIRQCGSAKNVLNCAFCPEYPCEKLTKFHTAAPQARAKLDALRKE